MIVDFAVEDDDVAAAVRNHRLVAGRRQVDNREPAKAEGDAALAIDPRRRMVRSAMAGAAVHLRKRDRCVSRAGPAASKKPRYAAHLTLQPSWRERERARFRNEVA